MADETGVILSAVDNFSKQINDFSKKLEEIGSKSRDASGKISDLGRSSGGLKSELMGLVPAFTAVAAVAFLKSSIDDAEKENEALRRLKFAVDTTGESFDKISPQVKAYGDQVKETTRFSDTQAYEALGKLSRITGSYATAQRLASLAMDISSKTGKNYEETVTSLGLAYEGNSRGLMVLKKEFGAQVEGLKGGTDILNKLEDLYKGSAEAEDSYTKKTAIANEQFEDMKKSIGNQLIPTVVELMDVFKKVLPIIQNSATGAITVFKVLLDAAGGLIEIFEDAKNGVGIFFNFMISGAKGAGKVFNDIIKGNFKDIVKDAAEAGDKMEVEFLQGAQKIKPFGEIMSKMGNKMADDIIEGNKKLVPWFTEQEKKKVAIIKSTGPIVAKESQDELKTREEAEKKMSALKKSIMEEGLKYNKHIMEVELKNKYLTYEQEKIILKQYYDKGTIDAEEYYERIKAVDAANMEEIKKNVASATDFIESDFADSFKSLIKGGESFQSFFKSLFDNIVKHAEDKLAELAANALFNTIVGLLTGAPTGGKSKGIFGMGGFLGIFDAGGEVLETGLYKLKKGEKVHSDNPTSTITKPGASKPLDLSPGAMNTKPAGNSSVVLNNVFNITGETKTAKQIAAEVGVELQKQVRGLGQTPMTTT